MKLKYYDKTGKEITEEEFGKLFTNPFYKIISRTKLPDGKIVSTVWLGLNHSIDENKPLIFETMVFPNEDDFHELYCERYSTEQEAIEGHLRIVQKFLKGEENE